MLVTSRNEVRVSAVELRWRFIQKAGGPAVSHRTHTNKERSAAGASGALRVTAVMENAEAAMYSLTAESSQYTNCVVGVRLQSSPADCWFGRLVSLWFFSLFPPPLLDS